MDLDQLANLGEFIGGLAVLVTLIYLAVQFGQAKEMMKMESSRTTSKDVSSFFYQLIDSDAMNLFRRGFDHFESMEPNDQARFHALMCAIFLASQSTFMQSGRGEAEKTQAAVIDGVNATMIRSPGIARWWADSKSVFHPEFTQHLDRIAESQSGEPLLPDRLPWYRCPEGSAAT